MAFSGNNQTVYNAALAGAYAGMLSGANITDPTAADYQALGAIATLYATKFDALVATNANLSTGAGGTTVDPIAGVTTASLNALGHLAYGVSFAAWQGRYPQTRTGQAAADFTVIATAAAAAYNQIFNTQYAAAPGGTSLT